ncbi:MAG: response regulator transcription factor [Thermoanaerobacteraceae bacterium]|nr:response regulator transcription factor [Thermoanaerobacteraceae bacterium]
MLRVAKILLVDDEYSIKKVVEQTLVRDGHDLEYAADGLEAQKKFEQTKFDLVILDVMLPGIDGFELCRRWREVSRMPILILSAKNDIVDKTVGFNQGADDYLTKPFSPVELALRVKALLRRSQPADSEQKYCISLPGLEINGLEHTVKVNGKPVDITPKEFDMLWFLARHPGQVFTRQQLFEQVWQEEAVGDVNTVTVFIRKLREKIEQDPSKPRYLKTVWGLGYKFAKD